MDPLQKIMGQYDRQRQTYESFTLEMESLARRLLEQEGIRVHSVTSRVKNRDYLQQKIAHADGKYSDLADVTDIAGLRIITYFADEVDAVARLIEKEFLIDRENSVDKRLLMDPDRFGYVSLHYVVSLSPKRSRLAEYRQLGGLKSEIQIRSILQHAWAEIEHDLGYKSAAAIPREIRRRFSRLAGLLEIGDSEFMAIRDLLESYSVSVASEVALTPASVSIDKASVLAYIDQSDIVRLLDKRIADSLGLSLIRLEWLAESVALQLQHVGLQTIADVEAAVKEHADLIVHLAKAWLDSSFSDRSSSSSPRLTAGVTLVYLCFALVAQMGSVDRVCFFFDACSLYTGRSEARRREIALALLDIYRRVSTYRSAAQPLNRPLK